MKAVVLLSGGMDSATCASLAAKRHGPENVMALSLLYGQKHAREVEAAKKIAGALGLGGHRIHELPPIFVGAGSTLVDPDKETPQTTYEELAETFGVSPTYVPFRNGVLLSAATALALGVGAEEIYYGAHAEDSRNWAYPDCTPEFNGAMANAIYVGTYHRVRLVAPLQYLDKAGVVRLASELGVPMELTWSCYNGGDLACGKCPTCVSRLKAFERAGMVDPVPYAC